MMERSRYSTFVRRLFKFSLFPRRNKATFSVENSPLVIQHHRQDVEEARLILLSRLPDQLAKRILTEAEYFARLSTKRTAQLMVTTSYGEPPSSDGKWLYMLSEPIPEVYDGGQVVPTKVHFVRFSTKSHDQGHSIFPDTNGVVYFMSTSDHNLISISGSYGGGRPTWFEASIFRPEQPTEPLPQWFTHVESAPINMRGLPKQGWWEVKSPYDGQNKRWRVQTNLQASDSVRHHVVKWSCDSGELVDYDWETGRGGGLGFTRELKAGDRIALIARARFPGWENHVYSAEIEIAYQNWPERSPCPVTRVATHGL